MRLDWNAVGSPYQAGVDRGVLYLPDGSGVVWNGLTSITEAKEVDSTRIFLEGQVFRIRNSKTSHSGVVTGFTYPDILDSARRKTFGLAYRVMNASGYEIHLLYGVKLSPQDHANQVIGSEISPGEFSWQMFAENHVVISSNLAALGVIEAALYGDDDANALLPSIEALLELADTGAILKITDNGDGTWTAEGPDEMVLDNGDGTFTVTSPSLVYLDDVTYTVTSY